MFLTTVEYGNLFETRGIVTPVGGECEMPLMVRYALAAYGPSPSRAVIRQALVLLGTLQNYTQRAKTGLTARRHSGFFRSLRWHACVNLFSQPECYQNNK